MKTEEYENVKSFLETLITKARSEPKFKGDLVKDPKSTIERFVGREMSLAPGTEIVVEDQTDTNTIYLNIPKQSDVEAEMELSDEQLELVAGGEIGLAVLGVVGGLIALQQAVDWIKEGWDNAGELLPPKS